MFISFCLCYCVYEILPRLEARYKLIAIYTAPIVPQNFASPLFLMSSVYYSGPCKNEYHTVKKLAKSFPCRSLFKNHLSFHVSESFFSPRANSWSGGGRGGGGGNSHISYKSDVMLVVSLRDWMNFYQRYRLRMCIGKYLHKKKQIPSNFVSISGQIKPQLRPTSSQGLFP